MTQISVDEPGGPGEPEAFKQRLQRFRIECGNPSFRALERLFNTLGGPQARSAIQAKVTGATVPDWPFVDVFVRACARHAGEAREPDMAVWREAHTRMLADLADRDAVPVSAGDPYRRLEAFGENDVVWFHGRGDAVEQVLSSLRVAEAGVLLLGPSGSGKSSLLHAGVLPTVGDGGLPGSDRWVRVSVRPGRDLLAGLDQAGLPGAGSSLVEAVRGRLAGEPPECRLLLVIDQFEELLTPWRDPDREVPRQEVLAQLAEVARLSRVTLVLVMRDDFYPQLVAQAPDLRGRLTLVDLPATLSVAQVDDIIRSPAKTAGLIWDDKLPEQILSDVLADYDTGRRVPITVLPVLELTLYQVWRRRAGTRLTRDGYRQVGGVRGALASWCTAAIDQLLPAERDCAQRMLTALVRPADPDRGVPAVRQQVRVDTLRQLAGPGRPEPSTAGLVDRVLAILTGHRIVTSATLPDTATPSGFDGEEQIRVPVAELVHDALIRDWPQLRAWVEDDHRFQDWLRRTDERHRHWQHHPTPDDLLHGTDLAEGLDWSARRPLPGDLTAFVQASRHQQQARTRRAQRLNAVLAGLLVLAVAGGLVAVYQWAQAQQRGRVALSRQLAAESVSAVAGDELLSMRTAIDAWQAAPTPEARGALLSAQMTSAGGQLGTQRGGTAVAVSPDGSTIAVGYDDGRIELWNTATLRQIRPALTHQQDKQVFSLRFSPDGRFLASSALVASAGLKIWDAQTGGLLRTLPGLGAVGWLPGTSTVLALRTDLRSLPSTGQQVTGWDATTGKPHLSIGIGQLFPYDLSISPDGTYLAVSTPTVEKAGVFRIADGRNVAIVPNAATLEFVSRDALVTADHKGWLRAWHIPSGRLLRDLTLQGEQRAGSRMAVTSDGDLLAQNSPNGIAAWRLDVMGSGTAFGGFRGLDTLADLAVSDNGRTAVATGPSSPTVVFRQGAAWLSNTGVVRNLAIDAAGHRLARTSPDGTVRLWDLQTRILLTTFRTTGTPVDVALAADGTVAVSTESGTVELHDATGRLRATLAVGQGDTAGSLAFTHDGSALAVAAIPPFNPDEPSKQDKKDRRILIWDTATMRQRATARTGQSDPVWLGFTPDDTTLIAPTTQSTVTALEGTYTAAVTTWRATDLAPLTRHEVGAYLLNDAELSPDGHRLALVGTNGRIDIWTPDGATMLTHTGFTHPATVRAVAFSPDSATLATATVQDSYIRLWDTRTGELTARLTGHLYGINAIAFTSNDLLASGAADAGLGLWNLNPTTALTQVCDIVEPAAQSSNQPVPTACDKPHEQPTARASR